MAQTLTQMIAKVRAKADCQNTNAVADGDITGWLNDGKREAIDLILSVSESYLVTSETFTLSNTNLHTLPAGFLKIKGLDFNPNSSSPQTVHLFNFAERNRQGRRTYRLIDNSLEILPKTSYAGDYLLWYVAEPADLAAPGDTFAASVAYLIEGYCIAYASIECLKKQQDPDYAALVPDLATQKERILTQAATRDSEPEQIPDVRGCTSSDPCDLY